MTFEWKQDEIQERLSKLLDQLVKVALKDDIMSEDEQAIIDTIREAIMSLDDEFAKMSGNHSDIEMLTAKTRELFEGAIEAAARQAREDGTITPDELILIDRLAKSLRQEDISQYLQ